MKSFASFFFFLRWNEAQGDESQMWNKRWNGSREERHSLSRVLGPGEFAYQTLPYLLLWSWLRRGSAPLSRPRDPWDPETHSLFPPTSAVNEPEYTEEEDDECICHGGLVLTLRGCLILSWVTEISYYSLGQRLKWVARLFLVRSLLTRSNVSLPSDEKKQNSSKFHLGRAQKKRRQRGSVGLYLARLFWIASRYLSCIYAVTPRNTRTHSLKQVVYF